MTKSKRSVSDQRMNYFKLCLQLLFIKYAKKKINFTRTGKVTQRSKCTFILLVVLRDCQWTKYHNTKESVSRI